MMANEYGLGGWGSDAASGTVGALTRAETTGALAESAGGSGADVVDDACNGSESAHASASSVGM